jgi:hypothetical protein
MTASTKEDINQLRTKNNIRLLAEQTTDALKNICRQPDTIGKSHIKVII